MPQLLATIAFALAASPAQGAQRVPFDSVFEWSDALVLEQPDNVIVVAPVLTPDPAGGWIVSDPPEAQVLLYTAEGRLKARFGRRGEGPGEFRDLVGAVRTESGTLVTTDDDGRITVWSAAGEPRQYDFRLSLSVVEIAALPGDSVLLATSPMVRVPGGEADPVLHVVDVAGRRIARSFARPIIPTEAATAWVTLHAAGIARSGALTAVSLPLLDSLWVFRDLHDDARTAITLGVLHRNADIPDRSEPAVLRAWFMESTFVGAVHGSPAHGWIVPLLRAARDAPRSLLVLRPGGAAVEIPDAPALVGFDARTGLFVFSDPESLDPADLRTARLRR